MPSLFIACGMIGYSDVKEEKWTNRQCDHVWCVCLILNNEALLYKTTEALYA